MPVMSCATPSARCWWCGTRRLAGPHETSISLVGWHRPLRNKAHRQVRFDFVPFADDPSTEIRIGVPERDWGIEAVDRDQHLLHVWPVAMQGHRIAPRRPAVAQANHAADIF